MPKAEPPRNLAAVILPSPDSPNVFGQAPAVHLRKMLADFGVTAVASKDEPVSADIPVVLCWSGGLVSSKAMLRHLLDRENFLLVDSQGNRLAARVDAADRETALEWLGGEGTPPGGLEPLTVDDLGKIYNFALRKSESPFCAMVTADNQRAVEKTIYLSTYKGVTDLVTKYVWPGPALVLTRLFLKLGLRPNAVTWAGVAFMFAAMYLFWEGSYGLGLLAAWIMALFDTVDGKMARVSHTSSSFGNLLDHGMDLIHPPFWYWAWAVGLANAGHPLPEGWFEPLIWTLFVTYILARLFEGYFIRRVGFHIHVWRHFDSFFRLIVARRNPNLILLTAFWAIGRPDLGILLVAAWQVAAVLVHVVQTAQAEFALRSGPLRSWLDLEAESASRNAESG